MFKRFHTKLLVSFLVVIITTIVPILYVSTDRITSISEKRIRENLGIAQKVLAELNSERRKNYRMKAQGLIQTNPQIRPILATFASQNNEEADLFGDGGDDEEESEEDVMARYEDAEKRLSSVVQFLPLYKESQIFIITDAAGKKIFSNIQKSPGLELTNIRVLSHAIESAQSVSTWWSSTDEQLQRLGVVPKSDQSTLYDVFAKPISYENVGVTGHLIIGFALGEQELTGLAQTTSSEIAFKLNNKLVTYSSIDPAMREALMNLAPLANDGSFREFDLQFLANNDVFLGKRTPLEDAREDIIGEAIIYRSLTREIADFESMKQFIQGFGMVAGVLAILISLLISRGVSTAINRLMVAMKEIRKGNLDYIASVNTKDEFSLLAAAVNEMSRGLKDKESITKIFSKYVDKKVVSTILEDLDTDLALGGSRKKVAVFFSDIANFTSTSEVLGPEKTVQFINDYLSTMSAAIEKLDGVVDKYIGDAIVAYWEDDPHKKIARLACQTALDHRERFTELKQEWQATPVIASIDFRIGIHVGPVIVGNIGSESRMNHTIMGDAVNTAARLESINKTYETTIMVSEEVYTEVASEFIFREVDSIRVKGRQTSTKIFELIGATEERTETIDEMIASYQKALSTYKQGDFKQAETLFCDHFRQYPADTIARVFIDRCRIFITAPPSDWDGVFTMQHK